MSKKIHRKDKAIINGNMAVCSYLLDTSSER